MKSKRCRKYGIINERSNPFEDIIMQVKLFIITLMKILIEKLLLSEMKWVVSMKLIRNF